MKECNTTDAQKQFGEDELIMKDLYRGFDKWLNTYGHEIIVSKTLSKSLHSVLARWIAKEDENNNNGLEGTEEVGSINGSNDDEEEGWKQHTEHHFCKGRQGEDEEIRC